MDVHPALLHILLDVRAALLVEPAAASTAVKHDRSPINMLVCSLQVSVPHRMVKQPWRDQPTQQTAGPSPQNWAQSTAGGSELNMKELCSATCTVGCCVEWARGAACTATVRCVHVALCNDIDHCRKQN